MNRLLHGARSVVIVGMVVLAAGCKGGGDSSDTGVSSAPASTTHGANALPTIGGSAPTTSMAGTAYSFTPTASDADGDALTFQIQNKPVWATFNTVTGQLTGKPTLAQVGAYEGVVISASDGKQSASLPEFTITVRETSPDSVTLAWIAPTQNVDGSALTNLGGYLIAYGTTREALTQTIQIDNPSVDRYLVDDLEPGTYYFGIKAFSTSGVESAMSELISKVID